MSKVEGGEGPIEPPPPPWLRVTIFSSRLLGLICLLSYTYSYLRVFNFYILTIVDTFLPTKLPTYLPN